MRAVFSSERIDFVPVSEDLIPDYLVMLNDLERVQRFITRHVRLYDEASEREWVRGKLTANAPIFSIAHYGIVGDLNQVLPALTKAVRERVAE